MRSDIIRGLRMGVILLTILFGGVVGYRMIRPAPSTIAPVEAPAAAPADPAPPVAEPAVAAAPVATPQDGPDVPPPPPSGGSPARRAARRNVAHEKVIVVDSALAAEGPVPLTELAPVASPAPKPEKAEAAAAPEPVVKEPTPATPQAEPAAGAETAPNTQPHEKRVVKAFRRLLHLPKKDPQQDSLKQP